jgi:hypothetical protein
MIAASRSSSTTSTIIINTNAGARAGGVNNPCTDESECRRINWDKITQVPCPRVVFPQHDDDDDDDDDLEGLTERVVPAKPDCNE